MEFWGQEYMEEEYGNAHKEWKREEDWESDDQDELMEPLDGFSSTEASKVLSQDF